MSMYALLVVSLDSKSQQELALVQPGIRTILHNELWGKLEVRLMNVTYLVGEEGIHFQLRVSSPLETWQERGLVRVFTYLEEHLKRQHPLLQGTPVSWSTATIPNGTS